MRAFFRFVAIGCGALALTTSRLGAQSVAGDWHAAMHTPGGVRTFTLVFLVDGEKLSGTVKRPAGEVPLAGTVKGDTVRFSYSIDYNGNPLLLSVTALVAGDSLRGTVNMGGAAEDEFSATRARESESVQYRSPAGIEYRSQRDTGAVARAERALAAEPGSIERIIQLGVAQSGVRQFREAIETFSRGLALAPSDPMLYRWRGHRYLSVREFDRALNDLSKGFGLDSTNYGILYHLGIVRYARGDFSGAAEAFQRAQPRAPDAGELAGATDWLWMSLSRAGRVADAQAMLNRRPDSLPTTIAYAQRLRLYRGQIGPGAVLTPSDTSDIAVATLSYGVGNWYLVRGDTIRAREWFERSVRSGGWPAFGFIMSEIELRRLPR
jgi:tetratricopeptide (TPR) repeat protein